jgi:hypothetical protein
MVQPIDYTMDVLSPMEGYMQGLKFGEGIQTGRLNRELLQSQEGREQEKFAIAKQDRARSIASAQAAQQNAAAAQAGLVDYVNKLEAGTATSADLRAAIANFPKMTETLQAVSNSFSTERLNNEEKNAKQLAYLVRNDPKQAELFLQERVDAAEASGDQKTAAIAKAQIIQLSQDHNAVLTQSLALLVTIMKPSDFNEFHDKVMALGGGDNAKVQSTVTVGNGRISVQTMTDGTTRVVDTATNTALTGEAAAQAIEAAEEASAAARGNIKKEEGTGTLEARIELGGEAAAKEAAAKIAQDLSVKAFTSINSIYQNIANLNDVKRLIGEGANTGRIVELLPDWNQATIELRNVQGKLGLDVVGSVTFGALNKSELDLALSIGLPTGLDEGALNKWVDRKIAAQQKLAGYLSKQAKFLSDPKNNLNDWLKKIEKESSISAAENKAFVEQMTAKVKKGERLTQAETDRLTVIGKGGE